MDVNKSVTSHICFFFFWSHNIKEDENKLYSADQLLSLNRHSMNLTEMLKMKIWLILICVEVLWPSQPNGVMSSAVSSPNHTFTGQA